jgi:hypothetical protein
MALGSVFQLETHSQGTEEDEIVFIDSVIREAKEVAKLGEYALETINETKEEFEKMLPTLQAAESVQERENLTAKIKLLVTFAVTSHLIPGYRSQDTNKAKE